MKKKLIGNAMMTALAAGILMDNVPWWRRFRKNSRSGATPNRRGKFSKAFQGEMECIRRRRQIELGIIPKDQLYVGPL